MPRAEGAFGQKPQAIQRGLTLHDQQRAARGQGQEQSQKKNKAGAPTQKLLPFNDAKISAVTRAIDIKKVYPSADSTRAPMHVHAKVRKKPLRARRNRLEVL